MRCAALLLVLLALTPRLAPAQGGGAAQMAALARLRPNSRVRVHVTPGGWLSGWLVGNAADSLVLHSGSRDQVVQTAAIDSVFLRHGHAGVGAGVGALVGFIVAKTFGTSGSVDAAGAAFVAGVVGGAVVGAVIGSTVVPSWERRLP